MNADGRLRKKDSRTLLSLLTSHNYLIKRTKGRDDGRLLPEIDPRFVIGDGLVHPDLLRLRVLLRGVCRFHQLHLLDLDDKYRTRNEWEYDYSRQLTTRRLFKAAKGQRRLLNATFYDPLAQRDRVLLAALEQDHLGLSRFVQPWIYRVLNPVLEMNWLGAKDVIESWPLPYQWMCCEITPKEEGRPLHFSPMREDLARQLLARPEIEGPLAALLLVRLWQQAGAEALFFRMRHFVGEAVIANREVGEAFGEDVAYLERLLSACVTGEPVPALARWKDGRGRKRRRAVDEPAVSTANRSG